MTYDESVKAIYILQSNYPSFFSRQSANQAEAMVLTWEACFADYSFETIQTAMFKLLLTKKDFPPTVAEINIEICKMQKPEQSVVTGEEAWGTAYSLVGKYGSVHYMSPDVVEKLEAEIKQDSALESTIKAIGGLQSISLCQLEALNTLRSQFIRIYNAYATRVTETALLPESIKARIAEETKPCLAENRKPELSVIENDETPSTMPEGVIDIMKNIISRQRTAD